MEKVKKLQRLPDAELLIMKILWEKGEAMTSAEIMEKLPEGKDWKLTTVVTLLSRLIERGFLTTARQGRAYLYHIHVTHQEYLRVETRNYMKLLHKHSLKSLVTTLYESNDIDEKDIDELMLWLKDRGADNV